eukprot:2095214-Rhodomonas_salina.1
MIRLSCWPRSSIAALLFLSCFCDWPACVGTLQDSDVHRVEWRDVPGRPLQGHALRELSFQQLSPHREHLREVEDTQLRRDEGALQGDVQPESYIVKVHRGKRNLVMQTIRSLYPETRVQYLPLDSYVVVVPLHIAKQVRDQSLSENPPPAASTCARWKTVLPMASADRRPSSRLRQRMASTQCCCCPNR